MYGPTAEELGCFIAIVVLFGVVIGLAFGWLVFA